jgi:hypothetical protein
MEESHDLTAVWVIDRAGTTLVHEEPARSVVSGDEGGPRRLEIALADPRAGDQLLVGNTYDVVIETKFAEGGVAWTDTGRWELGCRGGDCHHPPETLYFRSPGRWELGCRGGDCHHPPETLYFRSPGR